jgi:hypothetical protein
MQGLMPGMTKMVTKITVCPRTTVPALLAVDTVE